jgi:hypothetical protein
MLPRGGITMAEKPVTHRRIKIETSVKGVQHAEGTFAIDGSDVTDDEYFAEAQAFFARIDALWPPPITLNT